MNSKEYEKKAKEAMDRVLDRIEAESLIPIKERLAFLQAQYPSQDIYARHIVHLSDLVIEELKKDDIS